MKRWSQPKYIFCENFRTLFFFHYNKSLEMLPVFWGGMRKSMGRRHKQKICSQKTAKIFFEVHEMFWQKRLDV